MHDTGTEKCGIVTFTLAGHDSMVVKNQLVAEGINVSFGGQQATPLYMDNHSLKGIVRASIHYYNTEAEVDRMCIFLRKIV